MTQDSSLSSPLHTQTHPAPDMCCLYSTLIVIIAPQMSYIRSLCLCLQGHSQVSQVTCRNKSSLSRTLLICLSFKKYCQTFIFWMHYSNQWLSPTPFYFFPPLTNSLSISLKTACSKVLKSVKFIFESSYLPLLPFPYSWCPHKLFSALKLKPPQTCF